MMYEILRRELANYNLQELYHQAEQDKGSNVEFHNRKEREANLCWNATRKIVTELLGKKVCTEMTTEAYHMAVEAFKSKITHIE